jgi:hypothetical protein
MNARRLLILATLLPLLLSLTSCSQGPAPPKPGTPAFFWAAGKEAYRVGDNVRATDNLSQVVATSNEFTKDAQVTLIILSSGTAQALKELAGAYEAGARMNRQRSDWFRRA